jgi:hypothetical protein
MAEWPAGEAGGLAHAGIGVPESPRGLWTQCPQRNPSAMAPWQISKQTAEESSHLNDQARRGATVTCGVQRRPRPHADAGGRGGVGFHGKNALGSRGGKIRREKEMEKAAQVTVVWPSLGDPGEAVPPPPRTPPGPKPVGSMAA